MAEQQYINYGATANDGTGDPLRDAFIKVDDNFSNIWAAGPVGSNITINNNTISVVDTNGNLLLNPNGIGSVVFKNSLIPVANNIYNVGSANLRVRSFYVGTGVLDVAGNLKVDGSLIVNSLQISNLSINTITSATGTVTVAANLNVANTFSANGNVQTSGYFIGDGSQISNISVGGGTEILNGTSNVKVAFDGNVSVGIGGVANVAVFSTAGLEVSGNVSAASFVGNGSALTSVMADRGSDTNNWDTLTQMGTYRVNRVNWSGTIGTPLDSLVYVGLLQVSTAGDATTQIFIPGTTLAGNQKIQFNRSRWSGTWTSWIKIVNDGQIIDAGSY